MLETFKRYPAEGMSFKSLGVKAKYLLLLRFLLLIRSGLLMRLRVLVF